MTTISSSTTEASVHCHDCNMTASSEEEARANGFCHVKVFDARRRRRVGSDDDEEEQQQAAGLENGYWLCTDCFHRMRETLLVVSGE